MFKPTIWNFPTGDEAATGLGVSYVVSPPSCSVKSVSIRVKASTIVGGFGGATSFLAGRMGTTARSETCALGTTDSEELDGRFGLGGVGRSSSEVSTSILVSRVLRGDGEWVYDPGDLPVRLQNSSSNLSSSTGLSQLAAIDREPVGFHQYGVGISVATVPVIGPCSI